jgi:type II secretory pathway pseudopilin PulG
VTGRGGRERGSALVEAMVAVAVLALILTVGFRSLGQSAQAARAAQEVRTATLIARSRLASVGGDIPLEPGEVEGVDSGFGWRVTVEGLPAAPSAAGSLLRAEVVVTDPRGRPRASLSSIRLGPAT